MRLDVPFFCQIQYVNVLNRRYFRWKREPAYPLDDGAVRFVPLEAFSFSETVYGLRQTSAARYTYNARHLHRPNERIRIVDVSCTARFHPARLFLLPE